MAHTIDLQMRKTHRFENGWGHLDQWDLLGRAKVLAAKLIKEGNGHDEVGTYRRLVVVGPKIPKRRALIALPEAFADLFTSRCTHEHDCCGCGFGQVTVRHRPRRAYSVITRHSRNY